MQVTTANLSKFNPLYQEKIVITYTIWIQWALLIVLILNHFTCNLQKNEITVKNFIKYFNKRLYSKSKILFYMYLVLKTYIQNRQCSLNAIYCLLIFTHELECYLVNTDSRFTYISNRYLLIYLTSVSFSLFVSLNLILLMVLDFVAEIVACHLCPIIAKHFYSYL